MALAIFYLCPTPDQAGRGRPSATCSRPLRHTRVWRFGLYYVVVFGAYVALAGWLPKFYIDTYGVSLSTAALLTATFIIPASLLRPLGGYLADRWGPRGVTYAVFIVMTAVLVLLSMPNGHSSSMLRPGASGTPVTFTYRLGPVVLRRADVRARLRHGHRQGVGLQVHPGLLPAGRRRRRGDRGHAGRPGGFFLPPAFGMLGRWSGVPQLAFVALLGLTLWSLAWLHLAVTRLRAAPSWTAKAVSPRSTPPRLYCRRDSTARPAAGLRYHP